MLPGSEVGLGAGSKRLGVALALDAQARGVELEDPGGGEGDQAPAFRHRHGVDQVRHANGK
ncbi:hypothetical protein D3C86_2235450 [compost metagenome]